MKERVLNERGFHWNFEWRIELIKRMEWIFAVDWRFIVIELRMFWKIPEIKILLHFNY